MEFIFITTLHVLIIILSATMLMSTPCLSLHQPALQVVPSHDQQVANDKELALTKLPRKLRPVNQDSTAKKTDNFVNGNFKPADRSNIQKGASKTGKATLRNHGVMDGRKGTRQKWVESNAWQFFTMDYAHVRRRRPIHNKSVPVRP